MIRWRFEPFLPRSVGFGPVFATPKRPAPNSCRSWPPTSRWRRLAPTRPTGRARFSARRRRIASPAIDANRSCRTRRPTPFGHRNILHDTRVESAKPLLDQGVLLEFLSLEFIDGHLIFSRSIRPAFCQHKTTSRLAEVHGGGHVPGPARRWWIRAERAGATTMAPRNRRVMNGRYGPSCSEPVPPDPERPNHRQGRHRRVPLQPHGGQRGS